jgi:hypothetical protein
MSDDLPKQNDAPLHMSRERAIQQLHERMYARFTADDFDRFQGPTALDAALDRIDDTVRDLTTETGMSNDYQTAAMLLAYAVNVAMGKPAEDFLAALDHRQIDPAVTHTLARAVTSLALAVVAWARETPPASEAPPQTSHTQG